jgi:hypothetical protein
MGRTRRPHYSLLTTPSATPHDRHRAACSAGHRRPWPRLGPWAFPAQLLRQRQVRPALGPLTLRSQEWSRGRRCRDAHASTRSSRGPCTANDPQFSGNFSPRPAVPLRTAPCSPGWARSRRYPAELPEHAARSPASVSVIRRRTGVMAHQVGSPVRPMAAWPHGSSELVKAHNPCRGRPSCRNTAAICSGPGRRRWAACSAPRSMRLGADYAQC